jgi:hypothetical protein
VDGVSSLEESHPIRCLRTLLTKNKKPSVFGEYGWGGKANFMASLAQAFIPRHLNLWPSCGADPDNPAGANAFDYEVRLENDLNAAASQRHLSGRLDDIPDSAF